MVGTCFVNNDAYIINFAIISIMYLEIDQSIKRIIQFSSILILVVLFERIKIQ